MRIMFYTRPAFFDTTLPLVRELSRRVDVHLVLEVAPESRQSCILDLGLSSLLPGLWPADPVLREIFPPGVRQYWRGTTAFDLLIHDCPKSIHAATWRIGQEIPALVRRVRPDVFHLEDVTLRFIGALPRLPRVPLVLRLHDPEAHTGEENWRTSVARTLTFWRVSQFVLFSDLFVPSFRKRYHLPADRVAVTPLGPLTFLKVWVPESAPDVRAGTGPMVLFFGRLSAYKGLDVLYRALPAVAARVPGLHVIVAGHPLTGYTPPLPPALPNGGRIDVLMEYIDNATLAALFSRATLVVCPYKEATQSGVVMNAFTFGVPVVATRIGGLPEYVLDGERGLLVPAGDANALAEAIERLLTDDGLYTRLRHGIEEYTYGAWSGIADKMLSVYERAIAGSVHTGKSHKAIGA